MYQIGEQLLHTSYGVCTITDIREEDFTGSRKQYYILHPINEKESSLVYIPVESIEKQTRQIYTPEQIDALIEQSGKNDMEWISSSKDRRAQFAQILKTGDTCSLLSMIRCLYRQKEAAAEDGKKLSGSDETALTDAKKKVHQEFACSLNIREESVPEYILNRLR